MTVQVQITVLYKLQTLPYARTHVHKHPSIPLCRDKGMHQNSHTSPHNHLLSSCLHVCDCVQRPKNNASQVFIYFHSLSLSVSLHEVRLKGENS